MDVKVLNFVILFSQSSTKKVYHFSLSKGKKIPSELNVYTFRLLLLTRMCIFGGCGGQWSHFRIQQSIIAKLLFLLRTNF